ncbi:Membrane-bound O-acyltransferase domain-containing protein 2 [Melipona quadrifasciata]|uniref:Membrane-bound O-acyltransferase domain-containing protein 2 n=1 Tax=Melipona quadrifasciata TaxID=166423 RepID=A0A0M9A556_9HYME|nr:Membrane-bound O-acyltransferase domain-containing protein 2 [Melipona quadrifasciata]
MAHGLRSSCQHNAYSVVLYELGKSVETEVVNFLLTQFTALILAGFLRTFLSPVAVTAATRHVFGLVIGLALGYFCFGRQAIHLAGLPALCYIAMRTQNPRNIQVVLTTSLLYLSCVHYHRQMYNYGSYTLDITGPLMVITQKVTSLAYSIHDGLTRREEELTPTQRYQAVKKMPTTLEYFSYVFHFQALMAGPVIFYRDYIDFIHGRNLAGAKALTREKFHVLCVLFKGCNKNSGHYDEIVLEPSPAPVVVKKVVVSLLCAAMFVTFIPTYPIQKLKDDDFLKNTTVFYKMWYLMVTTMLVRFKYYHAWIFADAICNNSGLGFSGYDDSGEPKWDLASNVDVYGFEMSLNLKNSIEHWNKGTNRWLRSIVYERIKHNKILFTYALSALWHGFYPGYYLTFANGAFFTVASRVARRNIRPYFLGSKGMKFLYDALTFATMRLLMAYITFSFILLEFIPSVTMYLYVYLFPHIIGLALLVIAPRLPKIPSHKEATVKESKTPQELINGTARKSM